MIRGSGALVTALLLSTAPYQCKSDDPARAREETPGEALWQLCGRFAAHGDDASARAAFVALGRDAPPGRKLEVDRWLDCLR